MTFSALWACRMSLLLPQSSTTRWRARAARRCGRLLGRSSSLRVVGPSRAAAAATAAAARGAALGATPSTRGRDGMWRASRHNWCAATGAALHGTRTQRPPTPQRRSTATSRATRISCTRHAISKPPRVPQWQITISPRTSRSPHPLQASRQLVLAPPPGRGLQSVATDRSHSRLLIVQVGRLSPHIAPRLMEPPQCHLHSSDTQNCSCSFSHGFT